MQSLIRICYELLWYAFSFVFQEGKKDEEKSKKEKSELW